MNSEDFDYFQRRSVEERERASLASSKIVADIHAKLARLYEELAVETRLPLWDGGANYPDLVFSLKQGEVWASWYSRDAPVLLGNGLEVIATMRYFLAQTELGMRLNR